MSKPKRTVWDLETSPCVVTNWGLWADRGIPHGNIIQERYIICGAWKQKGKSKAYSVRVTSKHPQEDKVVVKVLHSMLCDTDEIIHHNGDSFDLPTFRDRALFHGLGPIPPVIQTDTKKIAKSLFRFTSNRLDYLGNYLGVGKKIETNYKLWQDCMAGDEKALNKMQTYNIEDVHLLDRVHDKLEAWAPATLNFNVVLNRADGCPRCGDTHLVLRGDGYNRTGSYDRYQCSKGHWSRGPNKSIKGVLR
jgi:hypothetical protein